MNPFLKLPVSPLCLALLALVTGCHTANSDRQPDRRTAWIQSWRASNPVWRGVHLGAHNDEQVDQLIQALPKLAQRGVNVAVVEVDYSLAFETHPEVRSSPCISKAKASELAEAAHALGIRLIPQLNCLGHQSWSKHTDPLLTAHPDFDETPGQYPDNKGIYCRSWCPQNPAVNALVFDLIDEMIDAFHADAFHVGMDEVFIIGSEYCPRCRGHDPAKLFAKAVNDLHRHIVGKRHIEMFMWGDRLLDSRALGYSKWEASQNGTQSAIDLIPKDIVVCDWHYEKSERYPSVPLLLQKGFRVWPSGWQPLEASLAFSSFARQQNNPRLVGYLCTTWGKVKIPASPDWPPLADVLKQWK